MSRSERNAASARRPEGRRLSPSRARWRVAAVASASAALALLAAACGGDGEVSIVALTPTATPAVDATPAAGGVTDGGGSEPTATPTPPPIPLPAAPESPLAGAQLVAGWLAGGAPDIEQCLPALVEAWGFAPTEGSRCLELDLDTDGSMELALAVTLPPTSGVLPPGDIWFFDDASGGRRFIGSARALANDVLEGVAIVEVDDLTGDGHPELLLTAESCGASTCQTRVMIASGHRGRLEDLAPAGLEISSLESLLVDDASGDGLPDLLLRGGTIASVGAGPQRSSELRLSWGGISFFEDEVPDPPSYLVQLIADADARFVAGSFESARTLYLEAAGDLDLADWKAELGQAPGRPELQAYALFRAGLASLRAGDTPGALALLGRAFSEHTTTLHGGAAALYSAELQQGRPLPAACNSVEAFLQTRAAEHTAIWEYGYANPEHTIEGLCR